MRSAPQWRTFRSSSGPLRLLGISSWSRTVLAAGHGLDALLQKNAARADQDRRLPEENIKAIQDTDLFSMLQPKRFGGLETDFRTKLEVIRELGRGCGSTSWTANLLTDSAWLVGMWNEQAQNDVWGSSSDAKIAGVVPPGGTGTP